MMVIQTYFVIRSNRCFQETSYHVVDASIQEYGYELYMMGDFVNEFTKYRL